jgi:hypothetical protein
MSSSEEVISDLTATLDTLPHDTVGTAQTLLSEAATLFRKVAADSTSPLTHDANREFAYTDNELAALREELLGLQGLLAAYHHSLTDKTTAEAAGRPATTTNPRPNAAAPQATAASAALEPVRLLTRWHKLPLNRWQSQDEPVHVDEVIGVEQQGWRRLVRRQRNIDVTEIHLPADKIPILKAYIQHVITGRSKDFRNCYSFGTVMTGDAEAIRAKDENTFKNAGPIGKLVLPNELRSGEIYAAYEEGHYPQQPPAHVVVGIDQPDRNLSVLGDEGQLVISSNQDILKIYEAAEIAWLPDGMQMRKPSPPGSS